MSTTADLTWTTARDGSKTAKVAGQWLAGCSVPKRATELMLRKLSVKGNVVCLLYPTHAQQIDVLLSKLDPSHAAIVIVDDKNQIDLFQSCCDFSNELGRRLFFATDSESLNDVFIQNPGLPIPQQFIRLPITSTEKSDSAIKWAQPVFSGVTQNQSQHALLSRSKWSADATGLCVVASSQFSLWNDAGHILASVIGEKMVDLSDARQTATGYIAERASECAAMITVDFARADQKDLIHPDQPWITWLTQNRVPAFITSSPRDVLLLADSSLKLQALARGWPAERIAIAEYPQIKFDATGEQIVLLANAGSLKPPQIVEEFSSWRLVWDAVAKDLTENPHRLAGDIDGYLEKARKYFGVPAANFPTELFVSDLLAPAYTIGIAKWLTSEGVPLQIYGRGFENYSELEKSIQPPVSSRDVLHQILHQSSAVIHPFFSSAHPVQSAGRPTIQTFGRTPQRILQEIRTIRSSPIAPKQPQSPLTKELIFQMLKRA